MTTTQTVTPEALQTKRQQVQEFQKSIDYLTGQLREKPDPKDVPPLERLETMLAQTKNQQEYDVLLSKAKESLWAAARELEALEAQHRRESLQPQFEELHSKIEGLVNAANDHSRELVKLYEALGAIGRDNSEVFKFGNIQLHHWLVDKNRIPFLALHPNGLDTLTVDQLSISQTQQFLKDG